ncbi:MAG: hypothetical protein M0Q14_08725 [Tissierellaceae bacterium]|nr:hypothetical protein [Tissierellaceae bacterium]
MSRVIGVVSEYKILQNERDYIVVNTKGNYDNHGHFKKLSTCYLIIRLMQKRTIPKKSFMLEAARRITIDQKYKQVLEMKQEKNKQRQRYFNPNKRVRR